MRKGPYSVSSWAMRLAVAIILAPASASAYPQLKERELVFPETRTAGEAGEWNGVDVAPGEAPNRAHPLGTVFVGQTTPEEPSPAVTEWDLLTGDLVRSAVLPVSAADANIALVRAGEGLHVVVARAPKGGIVYARLTPTLEIQEVTNLGQGEPPRLASDGALVAILWSGTRTAGPREPGLQLVVRGADGSSSATCLARTTTSAWLPGDPLAVARGRVFVLLPDGASPRLVRTDGAARIESVRTLPWCPDDARLFSSRGRVLFTDDAGLVELWPDDHALEGLARIPGRALARGRASLGFRASSNERGELLTSEGDVLSATFVLRAAVRPPSRGDVVRPLWLFGSPALLSVRRRTGRPVLTWTPPP